MSDTLKQEIFENPSFVEAVAKLSEQEKESVVASLEEYIKEWNRCVLKPLRLFSQQHG